MNASSWEEIANEVAPVDSPVRGLATGALRGRRRVSPDAPQSTLSAGARVVACPPIARGTSFDKVLCGAIQTHERHGSHYAIRKTAPDYDADYASLAPRLKAVLERENEAELLGANLRDLVFTDIETTGLSSGVPLFLIGSLWFDAEETPHVELLLARSFEEERAVLAAYHARSRNKVLVTFNGKSFDWPYICGRSVRHNLRFGRPRAHLDVLHLARRKWKSSAPNCRLQTLETFICNRAREGDIASSRIPDAYHQWIELGDADRGAPLLAPILFHNALDVLTMAELLCRAGED